MTELEEDWDEDGFDFDEWYEHHEPWAIKWLADSASTLEQIADTLLHYSLALRERHDAGWVLDQPVDNGHFEANPPNGMKVAEALRLLPSYQEDN
jgi:hypothetical protein